MRTFFRYGNTNEPSPLHFSPSNCAASSQAQVSSRLPQRARASVDGPAISLHLAARCCSTLHLRSEASLAAGERRRQCTSEDSNSRPSRSDTKCSVTWHRADRCAKTSALVSNAIALYATLIQGYSIYMPLIYTYVYL